jgi:hypothetical protein
MNGQKNTSLVVNSFEDKDRLQHRALSVTLEHLSQLCGGSIPAGELILTSSLVHRALYAFGDPVHSVLSLASCEPSSTNTGNARRFNFDMKN